MCLSTSTKWGTAQWELECQGWEGRKSLQRCLCLAHRLCLVIGVLNSGPYHCIHASTFCLIFFSVRILMLFARDLLIMQLQLQVRATMPHMQLLIQSIYLCVCLEFLFYSMELYQTPYINISCTCDVHSICFQLMFGFLLCARNYVCCKY